MHMFKSFTNCRQNNFNDHQRFVKPQHNLIRLRPQFTKLLPSKAIVSIIRTKSNYMFCLI